MKEKLSEQEKFKQLAMRIAGIRDACGYEVEEFAEMLEVPLETYLKYEETGYDVPISTLFHIASICEVDLSELMTGISAKLDTYQVVRAGTGREVERLPGYHFQDLADRFADKVFQPLLVTINPNDADAALVSHAGHEFNYVLEGTIVLVLADRELVLNAGDSVYFNPQMPHGQRCGSDEPAKFITIITEKAID